MYALTPTSPLADNETVITSFVAHRGTYYRNGAWLAAGAMALGMAILWFMGNPHVWTGAVGGLLAVAVRVFYVASDELAVRWDLTNQRLLGPGNRITALSDIQDIKSLGSAVQVVTATGDKHLIKYQLDTDATKRQIKAAQAGDRI
ncbi:hypothetical protein [Aestuariibius sp. HNIBRBA575]|uniref:hypothetical protein n=1 Tax=Aestuariibius sp. HNIBRBA575 TaxID=3233343 RepID=UPI0034A291FB